MDGSRRRQCGLDWRHRGHWQKVGRGVSIGSFVQTIRVPACHLVTATLAFTVVPAPLLAQQPARPASIRDLPRPGFETGRWRVGSTTLFPELTVSALSDDNLFATDTDRQHAWQLRMSPRIEAISTGRQLRLESQAYADARIHPGFSSEDQVTFGLGTAAVLAAGRHLNLSAGLRYDRGAERRSDPEVSRDLRRPAHFDAVEGRLGAALRGSRFGVRVLPSVQTVNFLAAGETDPASRAQLEDRDQTSLRLPVRFSWIASPRIDLFVEPFVNRRDVRLRVDRTGVDRDATTLGAQVGVALDIAARWQGEFGAGMFRADSDDPSLASFSGLSLNGNLRWSPVPRTGISLSAFSGDVATVRFGAIGRVDTRLALRLEQEVRHNLLVFAGIAHLNTSFRGGNEGRLRSVGADAEVEWLLTRTLAVFARVDHETRRATNPTDRFARTAAGIGLRLRT